VLCKTISQGNAGAGLPPQFFIWPCRRAISIPYISGPRTLLRRAPKHVAIYAADAVKYGLHLGPLVDLQRPDPGDDRDHPTARRGLRRNI